MDEADAGNEMADKLNAAYLSVRKKEGPPPKGSCYFCDTPLPGGKRWCDADCMTDYTKMQRGKL